jgi:hypothetical protein
MPLAIEECDAKLSHTQDAAEVSHEIRVYAEGGIRSVN